MTLLAIKRYLQVQQQASLAEIKQALGMSDEVQLLQMLNVWMRKGCVHCETQQSACHLSCKGCPMAAEQVQYVWNSY